MLDQSFSTLLADLNDRGLLDTTLVLLLTEFGRTPLVNKSAGRDHWPRVFSVIVAGAGIPGGLVLGASDRLGGEPTERPITPKNLAATIYSFLGLDSSSEYVSSEGRPHASWTMRDDWRTLERQCAERLVRVVLRG